MNRQVKVFGKKTNIILSLLLFVACSIEQTDLEYYGSGTIKSEYPLIHNKREGTGYQYFENGDIKQKSNWKSGLKDGETVLFYKNGMKKMVAHFKNGLQNGEALFYDSMGRLRERQLYLDNVLSGDFQVFNIDGSIKIEGSYSDSGRVSTAYEYFETGEHKSYSHSRNDSLFYKKEYNKNGKIISCYFTLKIDKDEEEICFVLSHSMLPSNDLAVKIDFENDSIEDVKVKGNKVCKYLPTESDLSGYFCEEYIPDSSNQGCIYFDFSISELTINGPLIFSSTSEY